VIVYRLYHILTLESGDDDEKLIGIDTTEEKAKAAIQRVADQPGFRDHPEGFKTFEHTLDTDEWTLGFISAEEAAKPRC
jgi:hypothetical protein